MAGEGGGEKGLQRWRSNNKPVVFCELKKMQSCFFGKINVCFNLNYIGWVNTALLNVISINGSICLQIGRVCAGFSVL